MKKYQDYLEIITQNSIILNESLDDYDELIDQVGEAKIVLIGEASHGTHEFYQRRIEITQRLLAEKNFNAIVVEGDWPDAYQINKYVHNIEYSKAADALKNFDRFPTWMWANVPVLNFAEWLKEFNKDKSNNDDKISFYGMDLYSLYRSIEVIIKCLKKVDPKLAEEAQSYYSCFDHYKQDPQRYGQAAFINALNSCKEKVFTEFKNLQNQMTQLITSNKIKIDEAFYITQNAKVIKNAENYYSSLFFDEINNWNIRDGHMMETVNDIIEHLKNKNVENPKIIVWAHNSHVGNSAATQMSERGEFNIGHLAKEQFGSDAQIIGFTTYHGTVSAASNWHSHVERKIVRNALTDSYEDLFHAVGIPNFMLFLDGQEIVPQQMLERAIGVIYQPETERWSHYFFADLANQFDVVIHCDKTYAIEPLEKTSIWIRGEIPETYPSGL